MSWDYYAIYPGDIFLCERHFANHGLHRPSEQLATLSTDVGSRLRREKGAFASIQVRFEHNDRGGTIIVVNS
jgi:hypothetical protein